MLSEKAPDLLGQIEAMEAELQPEFGKRQTYIDQTSGYTFYSPSYHFHRGLITLEDVENMANKKAKILVVGSGPAYLEQVLVQLGVPTSQIVCADQDTTRIPTGFTTYQFNYRHPWPDIHEGPFDLILFPSSFPSLDQSTRTIESILTFACAVLNRDGEIRADRYRGRHVKNLTESNPALNISYDALNNLLTVTPAKV